MTGREAARQILTMVLDDVTSYGENAGQLHREGSLILSRRYSDYADAANIIANKILMSIQDGEFD